VLKRKRLIIYLAIANGYKKTSEEANRKPNDQNQKGK
jgi:hypothetical protein